MLNEFIKFILSNRRVNLFIKVLKNLKNSQKMVTLQLNKIFKKYKTFNIILIIGKIG